jgi:hypothetical protein
MVRHHSLTPAGARRAWDGFYYVYFYANWPASASDPKRTSTTSGYDAKPTNDGRCRVTGRKEFRCRPPVLFRYKAGSLFPRDHLCQSDAPLLKISPLILRHRLEVGSHQHVESKGWEPFFSYLLG